MQDDTAQAGKKPLALSDHDIEFEADQAAAHSQGREAEAEYVRRCQEAMTPDCPGWAYLGGRGFSDDEIKGLGFGFDAHPRHGWKDAAGQWVNGPRIVIPWAGCDWYHVDRAISDDVSQAKYVKPREEDVGSQPVYNPDALKEDHLFVVEGLLDALALKAVGQSAMALGGVGYSATVSLISNRGYGGVVIALLDNDTTGRNRNGELEDALAREGIATYAPVLGGWPHKDACEALQADRAALRDFADHVAAEAHERADEAAQERYEKALSGMRALDPLDVLLGIYSLADEDRPIPTGLRGLDDALGGGLRRGVTTIGATSSLGKTTLVLQIADNVAKAGHPCLFVTIEQSATELVGKSISRIMRASYGLTLPTNEIMSRDARKAWGHGKRAAFDSALADYSGEVAPHMRIFEATSQPHVADVGEIARFMARHDGVPPLICIDYLQLLAADDEHDSDKTRIDKNMMALRQLARDLRTTVIVISSLNRASYSDAIGLDSFKESGSVEYSSDVLLGLQPANMAKRLAGASDAKRKYTGALIVAETKAQPVRDCELVVLKNRNGGLPADGIPLKFIAAASLFRDGKAMGGSVDWGDAEVVDGVI